jgi:hypothetical protein
MAQEASGCICIDCKGNLLKKFEELISSFDEDTQKTIYELIDIRDSLQNALHNDIDSSIAKLAAKGCVKINISFSGKTATNNKIKLKDDVIVRIEE